MNNSTQNVLIAAVGGQGALLAARVLGYFAQTIGLDVKVSEIHGMSQRGGSVVTHVRFGQQVFSPVIEKGGADTILAFETLEAMRYADYLHEGGTIILNEQQIPPLPVLTGVASYPTEINDRLGALNARSIVLDARALAEQAGTEKAVNTVLLGVYAGQRGDDRSPWLSALDAAVPRRHLSTNLAAFDLGYAAASQSPQALD